VGTHTFTAKYSGNTIYSPQTSNTVTVEVKKETAGTKTPNNSGISIVTANSKQYLKGLKTDDEVVVIDCSGRVLISKVAKFNQMPLNFRGIGVVKVKSGSNFIIIKSVFY